MSEKSDLEYMLKHGYYWDITPYTEKHLKAYLRKILNAHRLRVKLNLVNGKILIEGLAYTKDGKKQIKYLCRGGLGYGKYDLVNLEVR